MDNGLCCPYCGCEEVFHIRFQIYECTLCKNSIPQEDLIPIEDYE